jgi:hypothetical protein
VNEHKDKIVQEDMGSGKTRLEPSDRQQKGSIPAAVVGSALVDRLMCQILQSHVVWPDIQPRPT